MLWFNPVYFEFIVHFKFRFTFICKSTIFVYIIVEKKFTVIFRTNNLFTSQQDKIYLIHPYNQSKNHHFTQFTTKNIIFSFAIFGSVNYSLKIMSDFFTDYWNW